MTDIEINAAVDYANGAKLFPRKTAAEAFEIAWNHPRTQAAVEKAADPKNIGPYPRTKRDYALEALKFTPEQIADRSVAGHAFILEKLTRWCANVAKGGFGYSLAEHRQLIALVKMEEDEARDAALAEGVDPIVVEWEAA